MSILDKISNHLEFLGYNIEKIEPEKKDSRSFYVANHSRLNTIIYSEISPKFIIFETTLGTQKKLTNEMDAYTNTANRSLMISRVFVLPSNENLALIRFEAVYIGEYSKVFFAQFLDFLQDDQRRFNSFEKFDEIFIENNG